MILDGSNLVVWSQSLVQDKIGIPGGGVPPGRLINTTAPLTGGGDLSADRTLAIPKATSLVDGYLSALDFTQFIAKENPITFNAPLSRVVDTVSLPKATGAVDGYLSAADFVVFSAKVSASRQINTTAPLTGGGDLSADLTIAMPASTNSVDGYLTSADHTTFAAKESALTFSSPLSRSVNTISIPIATASVNGYLSSADWTTFNAKVATTRNIATTSPLLGGGTLAADLSLTLDFTTSWTWTANGIAATPTDRIQLSNTTAAVAGTQQYSPAMRFTGQGWKTNATAASQAVDFRIYCQPVQGASVATGNLMIENSVAGAAFSNCMAIGLNTVTFGSAAQISIVSGAGIDLSNSRDFSFSGTLAGKLRWGSTNASPMLKRNSTAINCRLADDSADAGFTSANFISSTVGVGFNGSAAVGKSSAYTVTNATLTRTLDVSVVTLTGLANFVSAMVADLKTVGLYA